MYPLSETQYCPCNKYNAQPVGNWSDCILPENGRMEGQLGMKVQGDIKECGQGYRYQAMVCYDQDNRIVETSRCNSHGGFSMLLNKWLWLVWAVYVSMGIYACIRCNLFDSSRWTPFRVSYQCFKPQMWIQQSIRATWSYICCRQPKSVRPLCWELY